MEGFKITGYNKSNTQLDFENEQNTMISYNTIRSDYFKKNIKWLTAALIVATVIIFHFTYINPVYLVSDNGTGVSTLQPYRFICTINWTLFSTGTYLIIYFIRSILMRVTPTLKEYISNEINNIGFKIQEKRKSWIIFLILNSISVLSIFLLEFKVISFNNFIFNTLFKGFLIIYLSISLILPVIWRISYDRFTVKLKKNYQINIVPNYRIRKSKTQNYQLLGIYFTSNRIAFKFNKNKKRLYNEITESRWLPKKKKLLISKYGGYFFLRFNEFSTPSNIQKQFLNIVLALKEWEELCNKIYK
ncbi:MAG: hypothetical protein HWN81_01595 [Candidatus Lokiarchaeota archaeon]|nr:hypothetical protein [Candidatus Lokiarchaeota archaeon]